MNRMPDETIYRSVGQKKVEAVLDQPVVVDENVAPLFTASRSLSMRLSLNLSERQTKRR